MTVKLVREIDCGETPCDIHGNHRPYIFIEATKVRRQFLYNIIIDSRCFERQQFKSLTSDEASLVLNHWAFMPHMRRSIREVRRVQKMLKDGHLDCDREFNRLPTWPTLVVNETPPVEYTVTTSPAYSADQLAQAMGRFNESTLQVSGNLRSFAEQLSSYDRWITLHTGPPPTGSPLRVTANPDTSDWERELLA